MRRVLCAALAAMLLLSGCGLEEAGVTPTATATATKTGLTEQQKKQVNDDAGIPPEPGPKQRTAFLAALNAIDPAIVGGKPDKAIDRARNQCSSVKASPKATKKLIKLTNLRFTSPDHPEGFGVAKSKRILAAVRKYICPGW